MRKILVINGPNLNLLGKREVDVYGSSSLEEINQKLCTTFPKVEFSFHQSNNESEITSIIHTLDSYDGMIINPGALSHYSLKLMDAMRSFDSFIIEVHLSNIFKRDDFRHTMLTAKAAHMVICGSGADVYETAVSALIKKKEKQ